MRASAAARGTGETRGTGPAAAGTEVRSLPFSNALVINHRRAPGPVVSDCLQRQAGELVLRRLESFRPSPFGLQLSLREISESLFEQLGHGGKFIPPAAGRTRLWVP